MKKGSMTVQFFVEVPDDTNLEGLSCTIDVSQIKIDGAVLGRVIGYYTSDVSGCEE